MSAEGTVLAYVEAWSTPDPSERLRLLEQSWADDGVYQDPRNRAEGRHALAELIAGFAQRMPGTRIPLTSGVDEHHGLVRFSWAMIDAAGAVQIRGFDVGELASDGRLRRISGFFGPFPPIPESWPERLVHRGPQSGNP